MTTLPGVKKDIIASRIRVAREMAGLSQSQVAKIVGLARPAISEIEAGRRKVSADELVQLAEIYAVDVDWLACKGENKVNEYRDQLYLAARNAKNLNNEDLDKVINLLASLKSHGKLNG